MTQEEKAKAYDEALEMARELKDEYNDIEGCYPNQWLCEKLFPELKESDDERIRKEIIEMLRNWASVHYITKEQFSERMSWLEKQSEQDMIPLNKVIKFLDEQLVNDKDEVTGEPFINFLNYGAFKETFISYFKRKMLEKQCEPKILGVGVEHSSGVLKECIDKIEQKSTDKVEPKFYEGEWLCENEPNNYARFIQILEIVNVQGKERYRISRNIHNDEDIVEVDFVEKYYHKFDIKDAEDGDVLCYEDEISLYKHDIKNCTKQEITFGGFVYHCCYDGKRFITDSLYSLTEQDKKDINPATKEQRDTLFAKIKDAGYEWDAEKKELKKIEQNPSIKLELDENGEPVLTPFEAELFSMMSEAWQHYALGKEINIAEIVKEHSADLVALAHNQQPTMWSEEDERIVLGVEQLCNCASLLNIAPDKIDKIRTWLKSLKDRVQPQPEWSEDIQRWIDTIIKDYEDLYDVDKNHRATIQSKIDILKSLRPQNMWKPSDEQIKAVRLARSFVVDDFDEHPALSEILIELEEQLKKLKGE